MDHFPITLVGRVARSVLATMEGGYIVAAFERSFYVESDRGGLICFGTAAMGAGPLNALCKLPERCVPESLQPGVRVERYGDELRLDAEMALNLRDATTWQPIVVGAPPARMTLCGALTELAALVAERRDARGFGTFIPALLGGDTKPCIAADDVLLAGSWEAVRAFTHWLQETPREREGNTVAPEKAQALVGLGPGLTPAGDDFLGGAMIALRSLGDDALAKRIAAWALPLARTRTSKISRAHLHCAADGEGAAVLHALLAAFSSTEREDLTAHVDALDGIGHSSGWDALAGVVCACVTVVHSDTRS